MKTNTVVVTAALLVAGYFLLKGINKKGKYTSGENDSPKGSDTCPSKSEIPKMVIDVQKKISANENLMAMSRLSEPAYNEIKSATDLYKKQLSVLQKCAQIKGVDKALPPLVEVKSPLPEMRKMKELPKADIMRFAELN